MVMSLGGERLVSPCGDGAASTRLQGSQIAGRTGMGMRRPSDKDREEPRQTFSIPTNAVTLGFVGRLSERKDHKTLLRALRILMDRGLESFLIIVETGPSERELKNLAAELIFTGCAPLNACRVRLASFFWTTFC